MISRRSPAMGLSLLDGAWLGFAEITEFKAIAYRRIAIAQTDKTRVSSQIVVKPRGAVGSAAGMTPKLVAIKTEHDEPVSVTRLPGSSSLRLTIHQRVTFPLLGHRKPQDVADRRHTATGRGTASGQALGRGQQSIAFGSCVSRSDIAHRVPRGIEGMCHASGAPASTMTSADALSGVQSWNSRCMSDRIRIFMPFIGDRGKTQSDTL